VHQGGLRHLDRPSGMTATDCPSQKLLDAQLTQLLLLLLSTRNSVEGTSPFYLHSSDGSKKGKYIGRFFSVKVNTLGFLIGSVLLGGLHVSFPKFLWNVWETAGTA